MIVRSDYNPRRGPVERRHAQHQVRENQSHEWIREPRHPYTSGLAHYIATVAYETGPRVGICMGQEYIGQGWHSGATTGVFSAAAAAALRDQRKHWPLRETHLLRARQAKL